MLVKPHYRRVIREIMAECDIAQPVVQPDYRVRRDATFEEVVQYTDAYVGNSNALFFPNARRHYRYNLYLEELRDLEASGRREAHVDIGCGAGPFSWAFLDWVTEQDVGLDRIDLYGLDHSPAMIQLAKVVRDKLKQQIPDYPDLHYTYDDDALLIELMKNHREGTDYVITFGHVLAQAHSSPDIHDFTRIIVDIRNNLMDSPSECYLVGVDARSGFTAFVTGWGLLLNSLESTGIRHEQDSPVIFGSAANARIYPAQ